ncbi:MAG: radical SAM protein, partial [Clostridia bacterium]|nr:radical SAM protein [Clostridia bacterium]
MSTCTLCPRNCGIDRSVTCGRCGCTDEVMLARVMLHMWEEPCISGTRG